MQLWIWRNIRIALPDDWEMLQYSRERAQGKCAFADRYQFRLELNWKEFSGPPDFKRMLSDYGSKLTQEKGLKNLQQFKVGQWQGVGGELDDCWTTRYGAWMKREKMVVEIVFIWPQIRDVELEKEVLRSAGEETLKHEEFQRWKTFGMELFASSDYALSECKIEPGVESMTFTDPANPDRLENFERRGMVKDWLEASVSEWLRVQFPENLHVHYQNSYLTGEREIERIAGTHHAKRIGRFGTKELHFEGAAWICPKDGRLYSFRTKRPVEDPDHRRSGERLACCTRLWVGNE